MHHVTDARSLQCSPLCPSSSPPPRPMTSFASGDTGAVATRMTSSRMIGRTAELAELEGALTDPPAGRRSFVFVGGESGVGKTRILDEAARRARSAGGRLLSGDCVELGEGGLAYPPPVPAAPPPPP